MKKITILLVVVLCTTIFTVPAQSALKKIGQTGLQFLKVDASARAAAMGGAYTMPGNDASAMFYNPAGIGMMDKNFDFFANRTEWIADISYNVAALAKDFEKWGTFGVSFIVADYGGDLIGTRYANNEKGYEKTGDIDVGAYAVGLSYARSLTDRFSIGGQIRYAGQHLGSSLITVGGEEKENKVSGFAFDFGTIFYPGFHSLQLGMCINNFSTEFKYEDEGFQLPLTFRIGVAMDVLDLWGEHQNPLLIAIDAIHPRDYTERIHVGGEYWFNNIIALRTGYKFNYDEEGFSAGVGFKQEVGGIAVKLDYAYSHLGVFEEVSRFSLGIAF
ncbi:PorV/PorQ family protein [candidate division KSB1 bacterium]|nr:PorV/PorQ family protein [candidate division KSB1 bacterium]